VQINNTLDAAPGKVRQTTDGRPTQEPAKVVTAPVTTAVKSRRTNRPFADWRSVYEADIHRGQR
jgi:hypothetical protein